MEALVNTVNQYISQSPDAFVQYTVSGVLALFIVLQNFQFNALRERVVRVQQYGITETEFTPLVERLNGMEEKVKVLVSNDGVKITKLHTVGQTLDALNDFIRNKVVLKKEKDV